MALQWMFILLLTSLLAAQTHGKFYPYQLFLTTMENPRKEVSSAPSSAPKRRFYCAPFAELLCNFMARRIQQLYQRGLTSTPGPKSTSWVVVRQSSVWGWRAAKFGVLGKPLQSL